MNIFNIVNEEIVIFDDLAQIQLFRGFTVCN